MVRGGSPIHQGCPNHQLQWSAASFLPQPGIWDRLVALRGAVHVEQSGKDLLKEGHASLAVESHVIKVGGRGTI